MNGLKNERVSINGASVLLTHSTEAKIAKKVVSAMRVQNNRALKRLAKNAIKF